MNNIETLEAQIQALLDKTEDKAAIEAIGAINGTISKIKADTTALEQEQKELLKDYKEVIKHVAFKKEDRQRTDEAGTTEAPKFEDFLKKK